MGSIKAEDMAKLFGNENNFQMLKALLSKTGSGNKGDNKILQ